MLLKQKKDLESYIHQALYNNLMLLSQKYPTTPDFDNVFKKDMFIKNNKAAFHHFIHFLLNIVDPKKFNEKVPTWPLYDPRSETQFRNEVMKYLNELSTTYEDFNIPKVMTSHLISPGGYKFAKYALKLTQFVIAQDLQKNIAMQGKILKPMVANKNKIVTEKLQSTLKKYTNEINEEIFLQKQKFMERVNCSQVAAQDIKYNIVLCNEKITLLKKKCQSLQSRLPHKIEYTPKGCLEERMKLLNQVKDNIDLVEQTLKLLNKCQTLVLVLQSRDLFLCYKDMDQPVEEGMKINLKKYIQDFQKMLERLKVVLISINKDHVSEQINVFSDICAELSAIKSQFHMVSQESQQFTKDLRGDSTGLKYDLQLDQNTDVLTYLWIHDWVEMF